MIMVAFWLIGWAFTVGLCLPGETDTDEDKRFSFPKDSYRKFIWLSLLVWPLFIGVWVRLFLLSRFPSQAQVTKTKNQGNDSVGDWQF